MEEQLRTFSKATTDQSVSLLFKAVLVTCHQFLILILGMFSLLLVPFLEYQVNKRNYGMKKPKPVIALSIIFNFTRERCSSCFGFFFKGYNPRINSHKLNTTVFKIIYLVFLVALGLHCCAWAFSSRHKWDQHPSVVHRLLTAAALVVEHRLEGHGFSSSSSQAQ